MSNKQHGIGFLVGLIVFVIMFLLSRGYFTPEKPDKLESGNHYRLIKDYRDRYVVQWFESTPGWVNISVEPIPMDLKAAQEWLRDMTNNHEPTVIEYAK